MKMWMTVLTIVVVCSAAARGEDPVYFADATLKREVEIRLRVTDPTPSDMLDMQDFTVWGDNISDLTGLEYATYLMYLSLPHNQISDVSPLAGLEKLSQLDLDDNQISDISPLAGLEKLSQLDLDDNQISDISPLAGLWRLVALQLDGNQIGDVSPLAGLTNLTRLHLSYNQISDVSPLAGLTELLSLGLYGNPLGQEACDIYIPQLEANGTSVWYDGCAFLPDVVGMTQSEAEAALTAAGFVVGTKWWTISDEPGGTVIEQFPAGGQTRQGGIDVDLILSQNDDDDGGGDPGPGPATPGLVAYWPLDESQGAIAHDDSGHGHDGLVYGDPAWSVAGGRVSGALVFDGLDDYIDCGSDPAFNLTSKITVGAWVNMDTATAWQAILTKGDSSYKLTGAWDPRRFHFGVGADAPFVVGATSVATSEWHHVCGTFDGAALCLYVDGAEDGRVSYAGAISTNGFGVVIGENSQAPGRLWHGLIDDVQIYDRALSADEVAAMASGEPLLQGSRWYVDRDAAGKNDGSTWPDAFRSLQDALAAAKAGHTIWVAQGVYTPDRGAGRMPGDRMASFELVDGVAIYGGFPPGGTWAQRDPSLYETVLSGNIGAAGDDADNSLHVVMGQSVDASTVLDGLTITAGNAGEQESPQNRGGGLYLDHTGSPTLRDCTFIHNTAVFGAGIYANYNGHSNPTLIRCNFIKNNAQHGGALYVSHNSEAHLIDCLFEGNVVAGAGAGIHLYQARVALTGCRFVNNEGESSGAIYAKHSEYTLVGCSFEGNVVLSHGGAIRDVNSVSEITDCSFSGNIAGSTGGAASIVNNAMADMLRCSFINNEAGYGGAVYLNTVNPVLVDCSFVSNICTDKGGAIYNYGSPLSLINCRLTDNASARAGGAIYNYGSPLSLINCRLTDNASAGAGGAVYNSQSGEALYCGTVFSVNTAVGQGGAVLNDNCQQTNYTVNCTFAGNRSENAGGATADVNSVHVMTNSILWGNTAPTGPQAMVRNGIASLTVRYCNLQGGQADVQVVGAQLAWEAGNLATDPLFVDAQDLDKGLALQAASPCIDAGDNTQVPADVADLDGDGDMSERMPLDAVGQARFVNDPAVANTGVADPPDYPAIVDIGAYERNL